MASCGKLSSCFGFCLTFQEKCHEPCQQKCQQLSPEKIESILASEAKVSLIRVAKYLIFQDNSAARHWF